MLDKLANLQRLDMFGFAPALQFQGRPKSYSHFGLIYTILTGAFVIWSIVFTSKDFVHRTNPDLTASTMLGETFHNDLVLTHDLFQLGFGIFENNVLGNYFIDPTIYTLNASMATYNYFPDGTCTLTFVPLNITPCPSSNFDDQVNYYQSQWCFSKEQANFDKLYTRTEDDQFIQVDFHFCNNATSGGTCAPQEKINKWITDSDIQTTFRQSTTIASNYKEPISHFYTDQWQGLILDKTKSIKLMLDVVEFTSDDGWLFESEKTETILNFNKISADILEMREPDLFASFIIANSGNKILYHRSYMKIQSVLAQVSGLAATATLILGFLAQPYAELKMYEKTVKDIYKIKINKKNPSNPKPSNKTLNQKIPANPTFIRASIHQEFNESAQNNMRSRDVSRSSIKKTSNPPSSLKMTPMEPEDYFPTSDSRIIPQKNYLNTLYTQDLNKVRQNETETQFKTRENYHVKEAQNTISIDLEKVDSEGKEATEGKLHSDIGYFEWLLSHVRFSPQISLLKKGRDEIKKNLDLLVMVKKIREIDKLKVCLMKKEERIVFENSQQPTLSIDIWKARKSRQVKVQDCFVPAETSEPRKVDQAYYRVRNCRHKTDLSEKLLVLYEREHKKPPPFSDIFEFSRDQTLS